MEQRQVGVAGFVVRAVAEDLGDDVGGAKHFGAIGDDFRTFGDVGGVGIAGFHASVGLDDYFQAAFCEGGDYRWNESYAAFTWIAFSRDADDHETSSVLGRMSSRCSCRKGLRRRELEKIPRLQALRHAFVKLEMIHQVARMYRTADLLTCHRRSCFIIRYDRGECL